MAEATYDPGNIFAKILRGEIPSHRIYEDDAVVAFMDVMPQGVGHTLVGADAPPQAIDAGGLRFEAPGSWTSSPPRSPMRRAQLSVAPAPGDDAPAELWADVLRRKGGIYALVARMPEDPSVN